MSHSILIENEIKPTQPIGAVRLADGTDNILVVVGDGTKRDTVHVWRSDDNAGQTWTLVTEFTNEGLCTNAILLAD